MRNISSALLKQVSGVITFVECRMSDIHFSSPPFTLFREGDFVYYKFGICKLVYIDC